jgi:hypothetical protein
MCAPSFGSELSLEVNEHGVWTVAVFHHEDYTRKVVLTIHANGHLSVARSNESDGVRDMHTIAF